MEEVMHQLKKGKYPAGCRGFHTCWLGCLGFLHHQHVSFQGSKTHKKRPKTSKKAWPGRSNSPAISRDKGWIRTKECTWGIRTLEMEPKKHPKGRPFWVKTSKKLTARIVGSTLFLLKHSHDTVIYSPWLIVFAPEKWMVGSFFQTILSFWCNLLFSGAIFSFRDGKWLSWCWICFLVMDQPGKVWL